MIAVIYEERKVSDNGNPCFYDYFKIRKIDTLKERELYSPDEFLHKRIAFNKQGTHLIAHGEYHETKKSTYKISSLKITSFAEEQVKAKITHNLQQYLRDKFVCNKFIEGKK